MQARNFRGADRFREHFLQQIGAVGDQAIDASADDGAHFLRVVGGPGHNAYALLLQNAHRNEAAQHG